MFIIAFDYECKIAQLVSEIRLCVLNTKQARVTLKCPAAAIRRLSVEPGMLLVFSDDVLRAVDLPLNNTAAKCKDCDSLWTF